MNSIDELEENKSSIREPQEDFLDDEWRVNVTRGMHLDSELEREEGTSNMEMWFAELCSDRSRVGTATIYVFRAARSWNIAEACDADSADLEEIASAITTSAGRPSPRLFHGPLANAGTLVIVDRLHVEPRFRGHGLGTQFLWRALAGILGSQAAVIATFPSPLVEVEHPTQEDWDRVRRFWTGADFVHFADNVFVAAYSSPPDPRTGIAFERDLDEWRRRVRRSLSKLAPVTDNLIQLPFSMAHSASS